MTQSKLWRSLDRLLFIGAFAYVMYGLVFGFAGYAWATVHGKGFITDLTQPFDQKHYYKSLLALIWFLVSVFTLWEIGTFLLRVVAHESNVAWSRDKAGRLLQRTTAEFKPTFLALILAEFLPRLIVIDVFWHWLPEFQKLALFTINFKWYSWVYAWLVWELSTWVWHFGAHRIRLFWCLHSPHHAPDKFNITVAWVHFFAEGYVTAVIQLSILMLLGVPPPMLLVIMAFEVSWGTLIHAGERSLKTGRLGILHWFVITPSHHRVHHAKNPLYMDTNFCTMLPVWDWLFGTLQPLRDSVSIEYGITRPLDPTNFVDFYFGECLLLYKDVRSAPTWRQKFLYLVKPPGWSPDGAEHTAAQQRREFLRHNPGLGLASVGLKPRHRSAA